MSVERYEALWRWFCKEFAMWIADGEPGFKIVTKDQLDAGYMVRLPNGSVKAQPWNSRLKMRNGCYLVALPSEKWNNDRVLTDLRMAGAALIEREGRAQGWSIQKILDEIDAGVLP